MDERRRAAAQQILAAAVATAIVLGSVTGLSMAASESGPLPPAAPAVAPPRPVPAIAPGDLDDPRLTAAASSCFTDLSPEYANAPTFRVWVEALQRNNERVTRSLVQELGVYAAKNDKLAYRALDCTLRTVDLWRRPQRLKERPARPECAAGGQRSGVDLNGARGRDCRPDRPTTADRPDRLRRSTRPLEQTVLPDSQTAKPKRAEPVRPPEPPMPEPSKPKRPTLESSKPDRRTTAPSKPDRRTTAPSKPEPSTSESSTPQRSAPAQSTPKRATPEQSKPERSAPVRPTTAPSKPERSKPGSSTPEQPEPEESEQ